MSYYGHGYHDEQMTLHSIDNRLKIIEEITTVMQGTLHNHTQWQVTMGHEMANLQQQQHQQLQHMETLFQHFNIRPPH